MKSRTTSRSLGLLVAGLVLALFGGTVHAQLKKPIGPPPPSVPKTPAGKKKAPKPPKDLPVLQSLTLSTTSAKAGQTVRATVKLNKPAVWGGPAHLYSSNIKTVMVPHKVPLPRGQKEATVELTLRPVTKATKVKVWATYGSQVKQERWITVNPADPMKVTAVKPQAAAWNSTVDITGKGLWPVVKVTFKNKVLPMVSNYGSLVRVRIPQGTTGTAQLKLTTKPGFPMLVTSQKLRVGSCAPIDKLLKQNTKLSSAQYGFCKQACGAWKKSQCETGKCAAAKSHLTTLKKAAGELGCGLNKKLYSCTMGAKIPQICKVIGPTSKKNQAVVDALGTLGCLSYYEQYLAAWKAIEDYKKSAIRPLCHWP